MAAATVTYGTFGRVAPEGNVAAIKVTVNGNGATYATGTGGLPFDLAATLNAAGPSWGIINPGDVVGILPLGLSTGGYLPTGLTVGTATYTDLTEGGQTYASAVLATFPCTLRLIGIGSAVTAHAALGETAEGANSDVATFLLLIARGGGGLP